MDFFLVRLVHDWIKSGDPIWMLGDAAFDMLEWRDDLIEEGVVSIALYNERNTHDPYDIDYRIEQRIKEHSDTVGVWSKQLKKTYEQRSQVERRLEPARTAASKRRAFESSHTCFSRCVCDS